MGRGAGSPTERAPRSSWSWYFSGVQAGAPAARVQQEAAGPGCRGPPSPALLSPVQSAGRALSHWGISGNEGRRLPRLPRVNRSRIPVTCLHHTPALPPTRGSVPGWVMENKSYRAAPEPPDKQRGSPLSGPAEVKQPSPWDVTCLPSMNVRDLSLQRKAGVPVSSVRSRGGGKQDVGEWFTG